MAREAPSHRARHELTQGGPRLGFAVRSLHVVSHLAGGRVAAKPFPGAEAEEGARPVGDHREAGEELEEEQTPRVSAAAAPAPRPSPARCYLRTPRLSGCNPTAARM